MTAFPTGDHDALAEDIAQALVGDVDPGRLDAFRFARAILPVFPLVRSLFSQSELDTCLKLMLLHEVSRAVGRSNLERIRSLAGFLEPGRVDALVRSLKDGGWLELRGSDNSYALSLAGVNLLALLYGADLAGVGPQNALARAAQTAEFNARLDGATSAMALLLDQLHALLEQEASEARSVLQRGRPLRLIAWSQRQHTRQLDIVRAVLVHLQDRLDAASREFGRIVRLHETMQELVRMHSGIHARLREWNLERLHTSDAGYAVPELAEAVLGVDPERLMEALDHGIILQPARAPSLFTDELKARFQAARRRLASQLDAFVYAAPAAAIADHWLAADASHAARLRTRITLALAGRSATDAPLELEAWITGERFSEVAWDLATLALLEVDRSRIVLDDRRVADVRLTLVQPVDVAPGELLDWMRYRGALRDLAAGCFARVTVALRDPAHG